MNARCTSRMSRILHRTAALPVAVACLLITAPAEAGWKPPSPGATAAGGAVAVGVAFSLRRNLGESADQFGEVLGAALRGDTEEVKRLSAKFDKLPGEIVRDSFPVLKGVSHAVDTSRAAAARLKEKARAAERRIRRLVGNVRTLRARSATSGTPAPCAGAPCARTRARC